MTHLNQKSLGGALASCLDGEGSQANRPVVRPVRLPKRAQSGMDNAWEQAQEAFRPRRSPGVRQHLLLARADIGERVRELREARGLSQRQAGGELISRSFISRLEGGERLVGFTVLQALTLSMPDVRFIIEAGELRIEELPVLKTGFSEPE